MSEFVGHEPCPECGSKDNLARYDDGHAHCFGCDYFEKGTDDESGAATRPVVKKNKDLINGEIKALPKRRITEETCKHFNYRVGTFSGKTVQIAPYYKDGKEIAQKIRFANKEMIFLGSPKHPPLFGQQKWRDGGKRLVVTEGEIDAMTISQLQGNKWPVVSVPNGAQGAAKSFAQNLEFLESYEKVIIAFDMDEPGREAAIEAAEMLSPGKAHIAELPAKDANEAHLQGLSDKLMSCLWDAKPYRPDGIVSVSDIVDDAMKPIERGLDWPWPELTKLTYGRRRAELYAFGGGTGCGKSTAFKQIAKHIMENDGLPVGGIFLEEQPRLTLRTLAGMMMGKRVHVPDVDYDEAELLATIQSLENRVFFYRHFGASSWDTIKSKIRYMVRAIGIKDIFLDHLTAVAAAIENADERKAIDKIMAELGSLVQELDCTIYFISHLTTPEGKSHEEGGRVLEKQFRGSRSIAYWSHFMFGIERDKQDPNGVTTFRVLKDRYTGDSNGLRFGLAYDTETGLLNECPLPSSTSDGSEFSDEELY